MELKDYLQVIRVRKWLIILAVVIVTVTAVVASLLTPKVYQGDASILVTEKDTGAALAGAVLNELSAQPERGLQTQVQLMQLRPLAERVIRKLSLRTTPDELMSRVNVTSVGQTNLVTLSVTDSTPQRAAATANAFASAYVEWSRELKRASITSAVQEVEARLAEAKAEILALGKKMNAQSAAGRRQTPPITTDDKELLAQLQIATGLYTTLAEKYETLKVTEQLEIGSGSVVSSAAIGPDPISPKPVRNGALGIVVGLVFGLGMAFFAEYVDNTIKSTDQAEKLFGAPVLGNIPTEQFDKGEKRRLTIVQHPGSRAAEAYRSLRNSIDYVNFEHDVKTVLVTSAAPGEGKSTVSANLAASLAMAGARVVVISCDFRRPTTDQFFDVDNQMGLSDVLAGRIAIGAALQSTADVNLRVLTPGKMPPNPSELLGSETMTELIEYLKSQCDWIIVDSPPLLAVADAAATARWTDGVLVITRAGVSTHAAATNARDILDKVGARILGVVVWGLDESKGGRGAYGGYYGGYYSEYYGDGKADSGARSALETAPARRRDNHAPRGLAAWRTGWRLATIVFAAAVVVLAGIALLLDGYLGLGLVRMLGL